MGYATGKHAVGQCQRCGFKYKYSELRDDGDTNLIVCASCYDEKHPAEEPISAKDNIALYRPAPDLDEAAANVITGDTDFLNGQSGFGDPLAGLWATTDYVDPDYAGD